MTLTQATLASDNTVYAQLILDLGAKAVRETAELMGITTKLDAYPAEGLGGLRRGVSPLEMANAYATLASGGMRNEPKAITKVVFPDGKSDDLGEPKRERAFSDGVAYEVTKILQQNVTGGTGTAAQIGCPAAGKTGTTDNFNDAWFVGYTPHLSSSVWVGYPNALVEMRSVHGISVAGGTFPAADLARLHDGRPRRRLRLVPAAHRVRHLLALLREVREHRARAAAPTTATTTRPTTTRRPATTRRAARTTRATTRACTRRRRRAPPRRDPPAGGPTPGEGGGANPQDEQLPGPG